MYEPHNMMYKTHFKLNFDIFPLYHSLYQSMNIKID